MLAFLTAHLYSSCLCFPSYDGHLPTVKLRALTTVLPSSSPAPLDSTIREYLLKAVFLYVNNGKEMINSEITKKEIANRARAYYVQLTACGGGWVVFPAYRRIDRHKR